MDEAEVRDFDSRLRAAMRLEGDEEVRAALLEAANVLRALEAKVQMATGLNKYERRKTNERLAKMASDLASVKHVKLPRKPFHFASRKYLDSQTVAEPREDHVIEFAAQHVIQNVSDEAISVERPQDHRAVNEHETACISGDFAIQHVVDSTITLPFGVQALYIDDCENCTVLAGVVAGAVHIERCRNCSFSFVCHQLRIHHTHDTIFHLRAGCSPIIEHTDGVQFKPLDRQAFLARYNAVEKELEETGLGAAFTTNEWERIRDFSYLKPGKSPNYSITGA